MVLELTEGTFEKEASVGNVVIDFWAVWCGPCKVFGPIFDKVSRDFDNKVKFAKVNVDQNLSLAQKYEIMSIPTTIFLKDGEIVDQHTGVMDEAIFRNKVSEVFGLGD